MRVREKHIWSIKLCLCCCSIKNTNDRNEGRVRWRHIKYKGGGGSPPRPLFAIFFWVCNPKGFNFEALSSVFYVIFSLFSFTSFFPVNFNFSFFPSAAIPHNISITVVFCIIFTLFTLIHYSCWHSCPSECAVPSRTLQVPGSPPAPRVPGGGADAQVSRCCCSP